jgi:hypothetical protein
MRSPIPGNSVNFSGVFTNCSIDSGRESISSAAFS